MSWRSKKRYLFRKQAQLSLPEKRLGYAHRRGQGGHFPQISHISCLFAVWEAVSKTNTVACLKSKDFLPNFCRLATPLSTRRDKHPKKLEAINGTFPWKVFIASQGHWKWPDNAFPRHSGKCEVYSLQRVNDQLLLIHSIFCTKHDYLAVTQFSNTQCWDSAGSHRFYRTVSRNFMRSANRLAYWLLSMGFCILSEMIPRFFRSK